MVACPQIAFSGVASSPLLVEPLVFRRSTTSTNRGGCRSPQGYYGVLAVLTTAGLMSSE